MSRSDSYTLQWLIDSLERYEALQARNIAYTRPVERGSLEGQVWEQIGRELSDLTQLYNTDPGIQRIRLLCYELDKPELTAANVKKLLAKVCRAKRCTVEGANAMTRDEVANVLDAAKGPPPPPNSTPPAPTSADTTGPPRIQTGTGKPGGTGADPAGQESTPPVDSRAAPMAAGSPLSAEDSTAFRPAKDFIDADRFPTLKAINKTLKDNPAIRRRRPTGKSGTPIPNRLEIHAGDWLQFKRKAPPRDALDLPAEMVDAAIEAAERQEEIRKLKGEPGK